MYQKNFTIGKHGIPYVLRRKQLHEPPQGAAAGDERLGGSGAAHAMQLPRSYSYRGCQWHPQGQLAPCVRDNELETNGIVRSSAGVGLDLES
eukprot:gene32043-13566_t